MNDLNSTEILLLVLVGISLLMNFALMLRVERAEAQLRELELTRIKVERWEVQA